MGYMKTKFIKRTYRLTPAQDKLVKKNAKKLKVSESGYIRELIDRGILLKASDLKPHRQSN